MPDSFIHSHSYYHAFGCHEHGHSHGNNFEAGHRHNAGWHEHGHGADGDAGQWGRASEVDNEIPLEARHAAYDLICKALKCWSEGETLIDINRMMQFVGAHAGALRDAKEALT